MKFHSASPRRSSCKNRLKQLHVESLEGRQLLAADMLAAAEDVAGLQQADEMGPNGPSAVAGRKWHDLNGNARHDAGEPGLPGVVIYADLNENGVLDRNEPRTVSQRDQPETDFDEGGLYRLSNLRPGRHVIREVVPDGYEQTFPPLRLPELATTADRDDEFAKTDPDRIVMRLEAGQTQVETVGVAVLPQCIRPIQVDVVASNDSVQVRNLSGAQLNGCGGDTSKFEIGFRGDGQSHRFQLQFIDTLSQDSFATIPVLIVAPGSAGSHVVYTTAGETVEGIDFGNRRVTPVAGSIEGHKWLDRDGDGMRDRNEPGLAGVSIYLDLNHNQQLDGNEPVTRTAADNPRTAVDETGHYRFGEVKPGSYAVREVVPEGYVQTFPQLILIDPLPLNVPIENRPVIADSASHHIIVRPGQDVQGIDFGNQRIEPGTVRGLKWLDRNGNGVREDNERGLAGVSIYADLNFNGQLDRGEPRTVSATDNPLTDFDETGRYVLTGLRPGYVSIREVVPEGFTQTFPSPLVLRPQPIPGPVAVDPIDVEPIDVKPGEPVLPADDAVPQDMDAGDADQDAADVAIADAFRNPVRLRYGGQHLLYVGSGQVIAGVDFGNQPNEIDPAVLGGVVWHDANRNGIRERPEAGIAGVTVYADLNRNGRFDENEPHDVTQVDTSTTTANEAGRYAFKVRPGDYVVRQVVPDGSAQSFPRGAHRVWVDAGDERTDLDFGNYRVPTGDFDHNGTVDDIDIDLLGAAIRSFSADLDFDLSGDGRVDLRDLVAMVKDILNTDFGDANLDEVFDSGDLIEVFQAGEYEDGIAMNSGWAEGDWNGDGEFDSGDLVVAFTDGGYRR